MSYFNKELFSGVLHKCGAKVKSWNKRWMVLKSDYCLYYYKDATKKSLGSITLRDHCFKTRKGERGDCAWPKNVNMEHTIVMVTSNRTYYMFAESADEAEQWKEVLQKTHEQLREETRRNNPLLSGEANSKRSSALSESSSSSSMQFGDRDVSNTQLELPAGRDKETMPRDYETAYSKDELEKIRFSLGGSPPSQNGINGSGGSGVVGEQVDAIYDLAKPEETLSPVEDYEDMSVSLRSPSPDMYEDMGGMDHQVRSPTPPDADTYEMITVHTVDVQEGPMSTSARGLPLPPLPVVGDNSTKPIKPGLPLYEDVPEISSTHIQQPLYEDVGIDTDTRIGDMRMSLQEAEDSGDEGESANSPPPPLPPKDTNVLPLPPKSGEDTTVNVPAKETSPVLTRKETTLTPPVEANVTPPSTHHETNVTPPSPRRQMNLNLPIDKTNASPPTDFKETSISPPSPRKRENVTPPSPHRTNVTPPPSDRETTVTPPSPRARKNVTPPLPCRTSVTPPPSDRETTVTPPSPRSRKNITPPSPRRTSVTPPPSDRETTVTPPSPRARKNITPPSPRRTNVTPSPPDRETVVIPPSPQTRKNVTPPSPRRTNVTPPSPEKETIVTPTSPCRSTPALPHRTDVTTPDGHLERNLAPPIPDRETRPITPPSPRLRTPPSSNLSPSPIPKPRSRSNTPTHPQHPRDGASEETFCFPPLPPKEPPKGSLKSGGEEPSELAPPPPKLTLKEIVNAGPESEAVYDEVLFEKETAVTESSRKERRPTLERGMALFLKCQERVKTSEEDYKKRTESIRVMESTDPSLSSEDKRLFAETLREVENERLRAYEERFSWERERLKLEEERRLFEQEKRKLREELERTRQQIQNT